MNKNVLRLLMSFCLLILVTSVYSQGGVGVSGTNSPPDPSAMFDVQSTSKGLLPPRMTAAQRDAIILPAEGLQIYNLDCHTLNYNAGTPLSPNWVTVSSSNSLPASVSIAASPVGAVCLGTSVTYTATIVNGGSSPTYQWKRNNEVIEGETNPTYTNNSVTNGDAISCVITSNAPCITGSPATSNIIAELVNQPSIVSASITADPAGSVCSGSSITFTATPVNGGTTPSYQWRKNGSDINGATSESYTTSSLNNNDQISCVITSSASCIAGSPAVSNIITTTIISPPSSAFTPLSATQNFPVTFIPANSGEGYSWTFASGSIASSTSQNPVVMWSGTGTYNVSLTLTSNGCSSTTTNAVTINASTTVTFNANGSGSSGSIQSYTIPPGVTYALIEAAGAQGGTAYSGSNNFIGGKGARMNGLFNVTPGALIKIVVGQQGGSNSSYNSGGGGGSFVWEDATTNLLIAAGGGGGGGNFPDGNEQGSINTNGNNGGQVVGAYNGGGTGYGAGGTSGNGGNGGSGGSGPGSNGGGAGWLTSGNGLGFGNTKFSFAGGTGGSANGGFGGGAGQGSCCGGGGGGGYSGGGGSGWASSSPNCNAPGGGGGSYNGGSSQTNTPGIQTGNGYVTITY